MKPLSFSVWSFKASFDYCLQFGNLHIQKCKLAGFIRQYFRWYFHSQLRIYQKFLESVNMFRYELSAFFDKMFCNRFEVNLKIQ